MKAIFWLILTCSAVSAACTAPSTAPSTVPSTAAYTAADESPSPNSARQDRCTAAEVDRLLFEVDMKEFSRARDSQSPSCFDWSSNECSWSPDMPAGFNFIPSCRRHDFGYQNAGLHGGLAEARRSRIDDLFKMDLQNECVKYYLKAALCVVEGGDHNKM
ncbi:hypothetical protein S7711_10018 [Stachybotrys chartarum IBT 7711]|uniref:Uncharacterized protein n=1 Tax=Stachybotrys chartarum (strain CBS 109288 / IBT 7711) TaxID=1280523 RepID=A0A084AQI0_STACB|nr:hypothetical protein S7711_10018 [Stachybotrys chartarum IBT 7711]